MSTLHNGVLLFQRALTTGEVVEVPAVVEAPVQHTGIQLFLPTWPDVIWSAVVLGVIAFAFYRFIMPKFMDILDRRTEMIDGGIKQAEAVRQAAQNTLEERHKMLEEAQVEAAKTRDQARSEGDAIIREARENAQKEAARIEVSAQRNLESQRQLAESQLRSDVGRLATQLAGKIIGAALVNEATKTATIDRFIDELESADLGTGASGRDSGRDSGRNFGGGARANHAEDFGGGLAVATLPDTELDTSQLNDAAILTDAELAEPVALSVVKDKRHFFRKDK